MTWSQRLWLIVFCAVAAGGVAVGEADARRNIGAVIIASLGAGVFVVALGELILRVSRPRGASPIRTLLTMLAILLPIAVVASALLGSLAPLILVLVFGGMALPIMWNRRSR